MSIYLYACDWLADSSRPLLSLLQKRFICYLGFDNFLRAVINLQSHFHWDSVNRVAI